MTVEELNSAPSAELHDLLLRCCGSTAWAAAMEKARPWASLEQILDTAERCADSLTDEDWREAIAAHPRIGDVNALRAKYATAGASWEAGEQSGVDSASEDVLNALAQGNAEYEARYGFIFLVCATGKSAAEMLELLRSRMHASVTEELAVAAGEQRKITALRIRKLVAE